MRGRARGAPIRWEWALALAAVLAGARPARAADFFEIQVFHTTVNQPGQLSVELHNNWVPVGTALAPAAPELPTDGVLFQNIEPVIGLTRNWEIGVHLQDAIRPDRIDWGGIRLRTMVRAPLRPSFPLQLALNIEGGYEPSGYDPQNWNTEIRPVIELQPGNWDLDFNPVLSFEWTGRDLGVPAFQPELSVRYTFDHQVALGVEYYGALGPVTHAALGANGSHYLFTTVDVLTWYHVIIHFGVGEGLTAVSSRLLLTSVVGYRF
jgi:hypothetical protein